MDPGNTMAYWVERRTALEGSLVRCLGSADWGGELGAFCRIAEEIEREAAARGIAVMQGLGHLLVRTARALLRQLPGDIPYAHRAAALAEGVAIFGEVVGALVAGQSPTLAGTAGGERLAELVRGLEAR